MTNLPSQCNSCGNELVRTAVHNNGDEVPLLACASEGIYAVVGMDENPVVATTETPDTTTHINVRTEFGDDLVLATNPQEGFYVTSQSEVEELVGTEYVQS